MIVTTIFVTVYNNLLLAKLFDCTGVRCTTYRALAADIMGRTGDLLAAAAPNDSESHSFETAECSPAMLS